MVTDSDTSRARANVRIASTDACRADSRTSPAHSTGGQSLTALTPGKWTQAARRLFARAAPPRLMREPAAGGDFLFFAADPDFQVVVQDDPLPSLVQAVRSHGAFEVVVVTAPKMLDDTFRRDWASRAREALGVPVLHLYTGSSIIG